jgi:hypothetical protein
MRWEASAFLLNPRIRQLERIADEADVAPTVLSEDEETVRSIANSIDADMLSKIRDDTLHLIDNSPDARDLLRQQTGKQRALGIAGT